MHRILVGCFLYDIILNPSNAEASFFQSTIVYKDTNTFENHLNPVMLVFIGKLSDCSQMSTHLPGLQSYFRIFHHFVLAKVATTSIRVTDKVYLQKLVGRLMASD